RFHLRQHSVPLRWISEPIIDLKEVTEATVDEDRIELGERSIVESLDLGQVEQGKIAADQESTNRRELVDRGLADDRVGFSQRLLGASECGELAALKIELEQKRWFEREFADQRINCTHPHLNRLAPRVERAGPVCVLGRNRRRPIRMASRVQLDLAVMIRDSA